MPGVGQVRWGRGLSYAGCSAIAKDGADLPADQATGRPTRMPMGLGEIADLIFIPRHPGVLTTDVPTQSGASALQMPGAVTGTMR